MTTVLGCFALVAIVVFVAWAGSRDHLALRRTLKQIRRLPEVPHWHRRARR